MFRITRILVAVASVAGSLSVGVDTSVSASPAAGGTRERATVTLHGGADWRWYDDVQDALERFEGAGLGAVIADVHVWTADQTEPCQGHAGWFSVPETGSRVDLCVDYHDTNLGAELRDKLVLHELAHAWIHTNLDDSTRQEFMDLRGAAGWNDPDHAHTSRGTEIAANTIMYALHRDGSSDLEQICGYELLTTTPTPKGHADPCT